MKKLLRAAAVASLGMLTVAPAHADIPLEYYKSLDGLKGRDLKNAVHEIVANNVSMLSYGSGNNATWWGFYVTDRMENNQVIDRYSNDVRYFGSRGSSVSGMNIEHSFPKSWWGGSKNNAYKDLFNLMPSEAKINSSKSNFPMGEVTGTPTADNGCTLVGTGNGGKKYWEPADKWKGDFARDYMYMATAYQNFTWTGDQAVNILEQGQYPTLQEWAYTLYLKWARADKVDEIEIKRNDEVYAIQGNRNPFVDFPNLMEYVWGDSTNIAFNPKTSIKSTTYSGDISGGGDDKPAEGWNVVFANTLLGDEADFTTENITLPAALDEVWTNSSKYGWTGTGHTGGNPGTNYDVEAVLWTPEFDFTGYKDVRMTLDHAVNFCADPAQVLSVELETDGVAAGEVTLSAWPSGSNWTFKEGVTASLTAVAGHKARIGFRYTSSTSEAATWEIKNMTVEALKAPTSIEELPGNLYAPDSDFDMEPEYYTVDGRRITDLTGYSGLLIIRRGSRATKVYVR